MFYHPKLSSLSCVVAVCIALASSSVPVSAQQHDAWGEFFLSISKTPKKFAINVRNCPIWNDAEKLCGMIKRVYSPLMETTGANGAVISDDRAVKFMLAAVTNGIFVSNRSPREPLKCPKTWQPEAPLITPMFESEGVVITMRSYRSEIVGDTCLLELVE
jgi:hypothetical protein